MRANQNQLFLVEAIQNAALSQEQKVYVTNRYLTLVNHYRAKYYKTNRFYNTLRITVMVGSIFIPALLTLQKDPVTIISETTYWVVFGLSLCVTLSNSLLELFNVAALNTKYWLHVHRLETEGWQFLHLSENYAKFDSLQDAFPKFASKIEKLHLSLVFDVLRLENKNKGSNVNNETKAVDNVSTNGSNGGGVVGGYPGRGSGKNLFLMPDIRPRLESPGLDNESTDLEQKKGSLEPNTDPLVISLHEFQTRLDDVEDVKKE